METFIIGDGNTIKKDSNEILILYFNKDYYEEVTMYSLKKYFYIMRGLNEEDIFEMLQKNTIDKVVHKTYSKDLTEKINIFINKFFITKNYV